MKDSKNLKVSNHAIARYMERTGSVFNGDTAKELKSLVAGGVELSAKDVLLHDFPLTRVMKGDKYVLFHAKCPVIAVVSKDNMVKTVLTKYMLLPRCYKSTHERELKLEEAKRNAREL